jgi:hypothetical protein
MTNPLTLGEAMEVLCQKESARSRKEFGPPHNTAGGHHVNGYSTIPSPSVVGIVTRIPMPSSQIGDPTLISNRKPKSRRVDIWLSDVSTKRVRFVLYGVHDVVRIEQERIRVGDVLRFNGVALTKRAKSSRREGTTTLIELQLSSSQDVEPGLRWFRLGRVVIPVQSTTATTGRPIFMSADSDKRIPDNMRTSHVWLQKLVDKCYSRIGVGSIGDNHSHWQDLDVPDGSIVGTLNPFPCKIRRLDELQSCVGLVSNIRVRVTDVHCIHSSRTTTAFHQWNRQRFSTFNSPYGPESTAPTFVFANVVDETGTSMSLIDRSSRLLPVLRDAVRNDDGDMTRLLLLTEVVTKKQSSMDGVIKSAVDEIVLVPTSETVGLIVHDPDGPTESVNNTNSSKIVSTFSMTQTTQSPGGGAASGQQGDQVRLVVATLADLLVNNKSVKKEKYLDSLVYYRTTILEGDLGSYRAARILLRDTIVVAAPDDNYNSQYADGMYISPNIVQTLCGDLNVYELVHDHKLARCSMLMLKALIEDRIKLLWTIVVTSNGEPKVTKVQVHDFKL